MCHILDKVENKGRARGRVYAMMDIVLAGVLSRAEAAAWANLTEQEFTQKLENYSSFASLAIPNCCLDQNTATCLTWQAAVWGEAVSMRDVFDSVEYNGIAKGCLEVLIELALDGVFSCAEASTWANLTEQEFAKKMEAYRQTYQSGSSGPLPQ